MENKIPVISWRAMDTFRYSQVVGGGGGGGGGGGFIKHELDRKSQSQDR